MTRQSRAAAGRALTTIAAVLTAACSTIEPAPDAGVVPAAVVVTLPDAIDFVPLNPARGDASPQAGVLWGDIRSDGPSGVLLKFADGFSSPPHIHNITYRTIVIDGHIHNDDPTAAKLWMGPGSYWTQPAGEVHITAAKPGASAMVLLEILEGPYLVQPPAELFDNGERPINVTASNVRWFGPDDLRWLDTPCVREQCPAVAFLWPARDTVGSQALLVKLPVDSVVRVTGGGATLRMVIVAGTADYAAANSRVGTELPVGAHVASSTETEHRLGCRDANGCIFYVRSARPLTLR
ncbi:MAG: DUF4437 domain-containing protein [Pseudomonadota bacterium]